MSARLLIIAGMPATGKSTLARRLSEALSMPILEKDEIKEALFDTVGYADLAAKRALDRGAAAVLLYTARVALQSGSSLIIVNNFDANMREDVQTMIGACDCRAVTVFLNGDPDVLHARYVARDAAHARHLGHTFIDRYPPREGDAIGLPMTRTYFAERFEGHGMADFRLDGPRIEVDATYPEKIDVDGLIQAVRAAFDERNQV